VKSVGESIWFNIDSITFTVSGVFQIMEELEGLSLLLSTCLPIMFIFTKPA